MKYIFIIAIMLLGMVAVAQNKTVTVKPGDTFTSITLGGDADTIITSQTYWILVNTSPDYPIMQDVYITLGEVSGSESIQCSLEGRKFTGDAWTEIISQTTWTSNGSNPVDLTTATSNRYRQYKIKMVASGATQKATIEKVELKMWYAGGTQSVASITDGTATFTAGALTGATTGAFSGNVTIGGTLVNTGLITANGGVTLGAGDHLTGSSTSNIVINTDKFTTAGATGNTAVGGTLNVAGTTTATGAIQANGGIGLPTVSTVNWAKGGAATAVATGTDTQPSNGARWWVELEIPHNTTITGLAYLVGSVGGTDSVVVQLCNSAGVEVASSRLPTGNTNRPAAIVGTAAEFQSVPFTTPYAAVAGKYYAVIQFNGNTARFRSYLIPGSKFITGTSAGTWGTKADITPGTTFTASKGPILMTY